MRLSSSTCFVVLLAGAVFACGVASAAAAAQPASLPAAAGMSKLKGVIAKVEGRASMKLTADGPWEPAKQGVEVAEGAEFRTGFPGRISVLLPPDQEIVVHRGSQVRLLLAEGRAGVVRTEIGLPQGKAEYKVEEAGIEHQAQIRSPGATLAVRGTENMLLIDEPPFAPVARVSQPTVFRNLRGQLVNLGQAGQVAFVTGDKSSAAETALETTKVDPRSRFAGRSQGEQQILSYLSNFENFDASKYGVLGLILDPNFEGGGVGVLPIGKQLRFFIVWQGKPGTDVDMAVGSPLGERVSIQNPRVASSGVHLGNGRADKNGVGSETVLWEVSFPAGVYTVEAASKGRTPVTVRVFVTRDPLGKGTLVGDQGGTLSSRMPTQTFTFKVDEGPKTPPPNVPTKAAVSRKKAVEVKRPVAKRR